MLRSTTKRLRLNPQIVWRAMSLSVGDRRWAILDNRVVEFLFVDQDENQVRVLLPAAFPEGQATATR